MSTDIEGTLIDGMRREVADVTLTADVLGAASRRHHRRTALLRATYAMGVLGLAGVTAAVLTVGGGAGQPGPTAARPPAVTAESPRMALVAAVTASENVSYRMRLTTSAGSGQSRMTYEGAFDPRTATGYVRQPQDDSVTTELLINGTRYVGGEPPLGRPPADKEGPGETYGRYGQYPGKHDRFSLYGDAVLGAAAPDPAALFRALKDANATVTQRPDGSLHFEYAAQTKDGSTTTSGDVTRGADGRVAKVALTGTWQSTLKGRLDTGTYAATLELFDYGVEVKVQRPADVVMTR
ncbi:hypothetical protein GA0070606_2112 [Micromonospora citrea]|uniref:Uncharacterized protein n=1 Tax=Micromonospora citrea TaxID=47855 RepID=A0A1C6UHK1_9ACTN|nr:hypothetical protein [Micromonospora citrea]SCL53389.1 hypothetical protein GA0070606_2112 [Micromonospora citrea]